MSVEIPNWVSWKFSSSDGMNFLIDRVRGHNAGIWKFQLLMASRPHKLLNSEPQNYFLSFEPTYRQKNWLKECHHDRNWKILDFLEPSASDRSVPEPLNTLNTLRTISVNRGFTNEAEYVKIVRWFRELWINRKIR
jgi:hypothetical protein